jgi:hypothetical protein
MLGIAREHFHCFAVRLYMKSLPAYLLGVLLACCLTGPSWAGSALDKDLTKQISDILTECKKITPGATRAELLKVFTTEGGLSTATRRTFVHRRCPYIKVHVEFTPSESKQKPLEERPADTISSISKPYLEWSITD